LNLFVVIPASVGLYLLALPIVEILFQHGKFTANDAKITAMVVEVWSLVMLTSSCVRVLVPAFYAIKNTWVPAVTGAICLVAHIIIAPLFMQEWGLRGLNFSLVISSALNFALLALAFQFLIGSMGYAKLLWSIAKFSIAAVFMAAVCWTYQPLLQIFIENINLDKSWTLLFAKLVTLALVILMAAVVYVIISYFLKTEELQNTWAQIAPKLRRKLKI
jgi:putative peptidoglycan lipid II flippase